MSKTKRRIKQGYDPIQFQDTRLPENIQERLGNVWTIRSTDQVKAMQIFGAPEAIDYLRVPVGDLPDSLQAEASQVADPEGTVWVKVRPQ